MAAERNCANEFQQGARDISRAQRSFGLFSIVVAELSKVLARPHDNRKCASAPLYLRVSAESGEQQRLGEEKNYIMLECCMATNAHIIIESLGAIASEWLISTMKR